MSLTPIPLAVDTQVNTYTDSFQSNSSVTSLSDGGFVVTWLSYGQDGSGYGIYGKRYDAFGIEVDRFDENNVSLGSEFQVNTYTSGDQSYSSVISFSDGGFVVTWSSGQDGDGSGIYGKRYDALGGEVDRLDANNVSLGSEFLVNTYTDSSQRSSSVTSLSDGGFVVTWTSEGQDGDDYGIYGKRYDASGDEVDRLDENNVSLGSEFQINTYTDEYQEDSSVTSLSDGGFVVTWSSYNQDGDYHGIYGKRYDASGNEVDRLDANNVSLGSEFRVNTHIASDQYYSSVTSLSDGGFVVTWTSHEDYEIGSGSGIYGKRYDASGVEVDRLDINNVSLGSEFQVNTYTDDYQHYSSVTSLVDGGFVVTWSSEGQDGSGSGIYGQRYGASGDAVGDEFRLNSITSGSQVSRTWRLGEPLATLSDGRLVATWSGDGVSFRLIDVPPAAITITGVVEPTSGVDIPFMSGDVITFTVDFDDDVDVTGVPSLSLTGNRSAAYAMTVDANTLMFTYTVQAGDIEADLEVLALVNNDSHHVKSASGVEADVTVTTSLDISLGTSFSSLTPIPLAVDTQVNTYTDDYQRYSSVTSLTDGGFVVTWSSDGQDGGGYGIYGKRYDAFGVEVDRLDVNNVSLGSEFQVNTYTRSVQSTSTVTSLSDGGFVVTWLSFGQDHGHRGDIYGKRYDAFGIEVDRLDVNNVSLGSEFLVNTHIANNQNYSSVTSLSDGGFVVTWSSDNYYKGYGIYGQRFDANNVSLGSEFQINTYTSGDQTYSSVTSLSDGGFVVMWSSLYQDGNGWGIYGQRFDANNVSLGGEFRVNTYTDNSQFFSSVTSLSDGGFVVTWSSEGQDGSGSGIYGKRYDASGVEVDRFDANNVSLGSEFQVNTYTEGYQIYSSVTSLSDGGFVVTWSSSGQDGSDYGIYGQRYGVSGDAVGDEFRLNSITSGSQVSRTWRSGEALGTLSDDRLVATWSGDGSEEVFFRLIDIPQFAPTLEAALSDSVDELANNGTVIGAVVASDGDNDTLIYSLLDDAQGRFSIAANTGVISVADGLALDFEQSSSHMIRVSVNNGTASTEKDYSIQLNDVSPEHILDDGQDRTLVGGAGNDFVQVGSGANHYDGGAGEDYIAYYDSPGGVNLDLAANRVSGSWGADDSFTGFESAGGSNSGADILRGTAEANTLEGFGGDDKLYGRDGADKLYGGAGNDTLYGNVGDDLLFGGTGHDRLYGGNDKDSLNGGAGHDKLYGGYGKDSLNGDAGNDRLYGGNGKDSLNGGVGNDILYGGTDNDSLYGDAGNDRLDGGQGDDMLFGGAGADIFHFDIGEDHDTIKDFEDNIDLIELHHSAYTNVAEVMSHASEIDGDVVFDFDNGDMLTVENMTIVELTDDLVLV